MDPTIAKVLRRVCAQHKTGIRKLFGLAPLHGDRVFQIVSDQFEPSFVGVKFVDVRHKYNIEQLEEVTPEAILTAINTWDVRQVMDS
jgi:hypothetical protein